jgi:hypothetical protein
MLSNGVFLIWMMGWSRVLLFFDDDDLFCVLCDLCVIYWLSKLKEKESGEHRNRQEIPKCA